MQLQELNVITTDKQGRLEPSREMGKFFNLMYFIFVLLIVLDVALEYNPSHLEMEELTFVMRSQWIDVARVIFPYLTDSEIAKIEVHDREDQALRFLQAWIDKYDLSATRESLVKALISVGLAAGAKEVFPEIYEKMTKVLYFFINELLPTFLRNLFWIQLLKFNEVSSIMT